MLPVHPTPFFELLNQVRELAFMFSRTITSEIRCIKVHFKNVHFVNKIKITRYT